MLVPATSNPAATSGRTGWRRAGARDAPSHRIRDAASHGVRDADAPLGPVGGGGPRELNATAHPPLQHNQLMSEREWGSLVLGHAISMVSIGPQGHHDRPQRSLPQVRSL